MTFTNQHQSQAVQVPKQWFAKFLNHHVHHFLGCCPNCNRLKFADIFFLHQLLMWGSDAKNRTSVAWPLTTAAPPMMGTISNEEYQVKIGEVSRLSCAASAFLTFSKHQQGPRGGLSPTGLFQLQFAATLDRLLQFQGHQRPQSIIADLPNGRSRPTRMDSQTNVEFAWKLYAQTCSNMLNSKSNQSKPHTCSKRGYTTPAWMDMHTLWRLYFQTDKSFHVELYHLGFLKSYSLLYCILLSLPPEVTVRNIHIGPVTIKIPYHITITSSSFLASSLILLATIDYCFKNQP